MEKQNLPDRCVRCSNELSGQFCSQCGRPRTLKRINGKFLLSEIASIFNFERGIFFTIKELLLRPGSNINQFLHKDRTRLVKPISFVILCSLIYILAQHSFGFEDGYINYSSMDWAESSVEVAFRWISDNYGFANILMASFIALWTRLFFRKYDYNTFEIHILLYFLIGIQMLIFALFGMIESLTQLNILDKASWIGILYVCWALAQFFDGRKKINYLKGLLGYFLGLISFSIAVIFCGVAFDLLMK